VPVVEVESDNVGRPYAIELKKQGSAVAREGQRIMTRMKVAIKARRSERLMI
jgi:hypothetical protein